MTGHPTPKPVLGAGKSERYRKVEQEIAAVLLGEDNLVAKMATVSSMLAAQFDYFFWTGFYVVDQTRTNELVVGPYQGTLGCLRIRFGRGVCGAAAATGAIQIVRDVSAFPGHIACDARSKSEIVVPVFDRSGALFAVLDVDAVEIASFDAVDAQGLRSILTRVFG